MVEALKDTIAGLMTKLEGRRKGSPPDDLQNILKKIFTKRELEHIRPQYFKNNILAIQVDSSSWLYALSLKKEATLNKLRGKAKVVIKDIRFSLGEKV